MPAVHNHPQDRPKRIQGRRPARPVRRRRLIPALWTRLIAMAFFVAALIVGMIGLTLKAVRPYREAGAETARLQSTRQQAASMVASNETLRRHIAYLQTPDGIAEEAHRLGYMRLGERPLVILGLNAQDSPPESDPGPLLNPGTASGHDSLFGRFQSHLHDL